MKTLTKVSSTIRLVVGVFSIALLLSACNVGGESSSDSGGAVTGVSTPSKVSVVNVN